MDLLVVVTTKDAASVLVPLGHACRRRRTRWAAFFTNDGVKTLQNEVVLAAVESGERAIVCQESWEHHNSGLNCPVELGSQTDNSALIAAASHVLSI